MQKKIDEIKNLLLKHTTITIVTHINPDGDTLGTGLGIYNLLKKEKSKKLEIVNVSHNLPRHLDFLPSFLKIKKKIEFEESLIIACDCGNSDRFGVNLEGREILNIDHHISNNFYGTVNVVKPDYASASQVAYTFFKALYPIDKEAGVCFYTALLSDTLFFTTTATNKEVFEMANALVALGVNPSMVASHLTQRRSLASLRILEVALRSLTLYCDAQISMMYLREKEIKASGVLMSELDGIVDYGKSLATVEIAIFIIEIGEGVRVSLRSKRANVSALALAFGGGGHYVASGFSDKTTTIENIIDKIIDKINELGLLNE